jgi:hypothetical protein
MGEKQGHCLSEAQLRGLASPRVTLRSNGSDASERAVEALEKAGIGVRVERSDAPEPVADFDGIVLTGLTKIQEFAEALQASGDAFLKGVEDAVPELRERYDPELARVVSQQHQLQWREARRVISQLREEKEPSSGSVRKVAK